MLYAGGNPLSGTDPFGLSASDRWNSGIVLPGDIAPMPRGIRSDDSRDDAFSPLMQSPKTLSTTMPSRRNWWDLLGEGHYYGTSFGEEAVDYWACKYTQTNNPLYALLGGFAALWTKDTWMGTSGTLAVGGSAQSFGLTSLGPWIGAVKFHEGHLSGPHTYAHIQLMLRTGLHQTSILRVPVEWLFKWFQE